MTPPAPWRAASPVRGVDAHAVVPLDVGWELAPAPAGAGDGAPETAAAAWRAIPPAPEPGAAPGTVAAALRALGAWDGERPLDLDGEAWWFRCRFPRPANSAGARAVLCLDGVATHARAWLNGAPIAEVASMFVPAAADVTALLADANELVVCCQALRPLVEARRGRPRWRTRLAPTQALRWARTALLGRVPGWTAAAAPLGPWRPVRLELRRAVDVRAADVRAAPDGDDGVVTVALALEGEARVRAATLVVGDASAPLDVAPRADGLTRVAGAARVPGAERWWPHTHGAPARYAARVELTVDGEPAPVVVDLGWVGFRTVEVRTGPDGRGFALAVNDVDVFCRGAAWTPPDPVRLGGTAAEVGAAVAAARDAGMNMLRVPGPAVYEADAFYEACDAAGVLVWQDFMFANLDYPADDPDFAAAVDAEAEAVLGRLQARPCLAVLCGGSEVGQQAAMAGAPRAHWASPLFTERLAGHAARLRPDVPYVPATPVGGALPFHPGAGVAHYFGVGAYRRPLEDARRAGVRFAAECLALSHVPAPAAVDALAAGAFGCTLGSALGAAESPGHGPRWTAGVPRDPGAAWDFEDVRDHYLALLYGVDPARLRAADPERYLALARAAGGEVVAATLAEWRRPGSGCGGALLWTLRDFRPGAGWGVLDHAGAPKAAYHYARRALQPLALLLTDEGTNGVHLHAVNDRAAPFAGTLSVTLLRDGEHAVECASAPVLVPARGGVTVPADGLFDRFVDTAWAYRFGPPAFDVLVARLADDAGRTLATACHLPLGRPADARPDVGLAAAAEPADDGAWRLVVETRAFAHAVTVDCPGYRPDDDHFDLAPGPPHAVTLRPLPGARADAPHGAVRALNARRAARVRCP